MQERTFSSVEVAQLTDISYRQVDHWIRSGSIGGPPSRGSGQARRYTPTEVLGFAIMARACKITNPKTAAQLVQTAIAVWKDDPRPLLVVLDDTGCVQTFSESEVWHDVSSGSHAWLLINVGTIASRLLERIKEIDTQRSGISVVPHSPSKGEDNE